MAAKEEMQLTLRGAHWTLTTFMDLYAGTHRALFDDFNALPSCPILVATAPSARAAPSAKGVRLLERDCPTSFICAHSGLTGPSSSPHSWT